MFVKDVNLEAMLTSIYHNDDDDCPPSVNRV